MERLRVSPKDIEDALDVVREVAIRTPTVEGPDAGHREAFLKLENLQRLGAFKIRGAWNRMSRFSEEERRRGVATISSGNHGLAVSWSAKRLGIPCAVYVPEGASGPRSRPSAPTGPTSER